MSVYIIYTVGLIAQLLFSARIIVQWISSERAHKVLSPTLFWQLSMVASLLLCIYGWMRNDFAIILGQMVAYYIYIWNLDAKKFWEKIPGMMRWALLLVPAAAVVWFMFDWSDTFSRLFRQDSIPLWLIVFGVIGQFTFTLRFIYQWWYSRRLGDSVLPMTFWLISITGSAMIIAYAIIRHDPILILGQCTGIVAYARNIMIELKTTKAPAKTVMATQTPKISAINTLNTNIMEPAAEIRN